MTTHGQRVDETPNTASSGARGQDDREKTDEGKAWEINDPAPDETDEDEDHHQSRTGGDYEGEAWRINENTAD